MRGVLVRRLLAVTVWVFGFAALLLVAWAWFAPRIEDDLTDRADAQLEAGGVEGVTVDFDGRDGNLRGASARAAEAELVGLHGARRLEVDDLNRPIDVERPPPTTPAPTTTTEPVTGDVELRREGGVVLIGGTVRTEAERELLVTQVENAGFDPEDRLMVDATLVENDEIAGAAPVIGLMLEGSENWRFELAGGVLEVEALANDPVEAGAIKDAFDDAEAAGLRVLDGVEAKILPLDVQITALQSEIDQIFELARLIEPESPNFGTKEGDLNAVATGILDRVVVAMRRYPLPVADVIGHADSRGTEQDNQLLSELRAARVVEYLVAQGIGADRFTSSGRGESEPVGPNETEQGRLENRRVDFNVGKREG